MLTIQELEQRIRDGIPIAAQMDFRVQELTPTGIKVIGGGEENVNVHGTAFAGSLYAICTLALWGLISARLPSDAALVLAEGHIKYRQPIQGEILAHCDIPGIKMDAFLSRLERQGKALLTATVRVPGSKGTAAEFEGILHARLEQLPHG